MTTVTVRKLSSMFKIYHIKKQIENHHLSMVRLLSSRKKAAFIFAKSVRISAIVKFFMLSVQRKQNFF